MSGHDLLPSSSSQLERDLSLSSDLLSRLEGGPPKIRTGKRVDIQDDVIPWLILEYGLGELLPYIPDQRQAVREGVKWQRVRGTPAAVRTALGWIGFDALIEESEAGSIRWADFQLGLDQAPNGLQFTENVVQVSRLSSPVRSRLFRIYGGWFDFRRFKLDEHGLSTGSWLCDHTGVYLEQDRDVPWPQLSFGREIKRTESFTTDFAVGSSLHRKRTDLGFYEDRLILDFNQLSDLVWKPFHMDVAKAVISRMHFQQWGPIWQRATDWTTAAWDATFDWANKINSIAPALKFCKAGMYLSDQDAKLGDTNACLPARYEEEIGVGTLLLSESDVETGEGILSEHRSNIVEREILERFERKTDAEATHQVQGHLLGATNEKAHHSEKTHFYKYEDVFQLNLTRLSEWLPLVTQYSNTRAHKTAHDRFFLQSDQWQDATGTWANAADWDTEFGWFDEINDVGTWATTYSWKTYPQLEQYHEETEAEVDLSEGNNVLGDLNYRLGSEFNIVFERFQQTTVASLSVQPNLIGSLEREHQRLLRYNDHFELDLNRLGEFPPLVNEAGYSRLHSYDADLQRYFQDTWNDSSPQWEAKEIVTAEQRNNRTPIDKFGKYVRFNPEVLDRLQIGDRVISLVDTSTGQEVISESDGLTVEAYTYNANGELNGVNLTQKWYGVHKDDALWTVEVSAHTWDDFPGWYDEDNEFTWAEAFSWVDTPALQRYTRHAKAAIVLSDSDPLSTTNATLGWYVGDERFDRIFTATPATYSTQTFETRQHSRLKQASVYWLPAEQAWDSADWAGPDAPDWANSEETWNDDPTVDTWGSLDWFQSDPVDWDSSFMWATIKRWTVLSTVVESQHTTI